MFSRSLQREIFSLNLSVGIRFVKLRIYTLFLRRRGVWHPVFDKLLLLCRNS